MSFLINYKVSEDLKAYLKNSLYYILKTKNTDFFFLLFLGGMEQ